MDSRVREMIIDVYRKHSHLLEKEDGVTMEDVKRKTAVVALSVKHANDF